MYPLVCRWGPDRPRCTRGFPGCKPSQGRTGSGWPRRSSSSRRRRTWSHRGRLRASSGNSGCWLGPLSDYRSIIKSWYYSNWSSEKGGRTHQLLDDLRTRRCRCSRSFHAGSWGRCRRKPSRCRRVRASPRPPRTSSTCRTKCRERRIRFPWGKRTCRSECFEPKLIRKEKEKRSKLSVTSTTSPKKVKAGNKKKSGRMEKVVVGVCTPKTKSNYKLGSWGEKKNRFLGLWWRVFSRVQVKKEKEKNKLTRPSGESVKSPEAFIKTKRKKFGLDGTRVYR